MQRRVHALLAALLVVPAACADTTGVHDGAQVTVAFSSSAGAAAGSLSSALAEDVTIAGSNGTLVITDVAFIVSEFKLERTEDACEGFEDDNGFDDDDCEQFETGLAFVELPLTGATVPVVTHSAPAGSYTELKFEVEDVDLDEAEDDDDAAEIASLLDEIHDAGYTDWPENASLVVVGTFTPVGGEPRPFTAYLEAEIKIEMEFDPALVVDGESGIVDVEVDPMGWFTNLDGTVIDLSQFDFATTGQVLEFEAKLEDGFTKIELEGFDDD